MQDCLQSTLGDLGPMKRWVMKNQFMILLWCAAVALFWTSPNARNFTSQTLNTFADVIEVQE